MISEAIKAIETDLLALPWVSRYGSIIKVASRYVEGGEGEGEGYMESFPISCNVSGTDCWDNGKYLDLVPNDAHTSITYFEEVDGFQPVTEARRVKNVTMLKGQLRFVGWFNTLKLGLDVCDIQPYVIGDLYDLLNRKIHGYDSGVMKFVEIKLELDSIEPKTINPFEPYSYRENNGLLLHPYDFISVIVNVTLRFNPNCLPALTPNDEIPCVTS